ncbi:DMT family transporter [Nitratireductor alexandrii]|uniref:DMT family transporter n=1 Tax=Nitratireductor alexandrii TaxID=2448161 RepID=UPI000FD839F5|nr:DMT family transporter [Nitratireductor alexandrii]
MSARPAPWTVGVLFGFFGMLGFSGTLAATRVAVADFSPLTITCARIVIAGLLGGVTLVLTGRTALPERRHLLAIAVMGLGLAVGYPFFLAVALQSVPAVHGAVVTGLAPAATAIIAVLRAGERPPPIFWLACAIGFAAVLTYAHDAGGGDFSAADGWLLLALLCLGVAYVEGGRVSAELGGTTTLCWAMLFLTPFAAGPLVWSLRGVDLASVAPWSWVSMAYLGIVSMFLAAIFWYRGLAAGGIARIGQINLLLPLAALVWPAFFLGETITTTALASAAVVLVAMMVCLKARVRRRA